jgi:cysteine desulfuration protein SufE
MSTPQNRQTQILKAFEGLQTWEEKYRQIIAFGKKLEPLPPQFHTDDYKVKGCQSRVWLGAEVDPKRQIRFYADSDAVIVKGLVAMLLELYSGLTVDEVLATNPDYITKLELEQHLSPSRAGGLFAVVKQIKFYALAFQAKLA